MKGAGNHQDVARAIVQEQEQKTILKKSQVSSTTGTTIVNYDTPRAGHGGTSSHVDSRQLTETKHDPKATKWISVTKHASHMTKQVPKSKEEVRTVPSTVDLHQDSGEDNHEPRSQITLEESNTIQDVKREGHLLSQ